MNKSKLDIVYVLCLAPTIILSFILMGAESSWDILVIVVPGVIAITIAYRYLHHALQMRSRFSAWLRSVLLLPLVFYPVTFCTGVIVEVFSANNIDPYIVFPLVANTIFSGITFGVLSALQAWRYSHHQTSGQ